MTENDRLDHIRNTALDDVDKAKNLLKWLIVGACLTEVACLAVIFLLMDGDDPLHLLLLCNSALVYGTLSMGLFALGAYLNLCTQRILKAISLSGEGDDDGQHEG
ncbi:MAG: hypothetical protein AAF533_20710 [Acidobacteriota bacterium]